MKDLINSLKTEIELNSHVFLIVFKEDYLGYAKVVKIKADTKDKASDKFDKWCEDNNVEPYNYEYEILNLEDVVKAETIS